MFNAPSTFSTFFNSQTNFATYKIFTLDTSLLRVCSQSSHEKPISDRSKLIKQGNEHQIFKPNVNLICTNSPPTRWSHLFNNLIKCSVIHFDRIPFFSLSWVEMLSTSPDTKFDGFQVVSGWPYSWIFSRISFDFSLLNCSSSFGSTGQLKDFQRINLNFHVSCNLEKWLCGNKNIKNVRRRLSGSLRHCLRFLSIYFTLLLLASVAATSTAMQSGTDNAFQIFYQFQMILSNVERSWKPLANPF